jgi:carbohydrate kinase (thermoresistant glucokinase family)
MPRHALSIGDVRHRASRTALDRPHLHGRLGLRQIHHRRAYRDILRRGHEDVRFVYLKGSYELLLARMQHRERHFMPASLLKSQFDTLEEPGSDEAITVSIEQPVAGILANTLAQLRLG